MKKKSAEGKEIEFKYEAHESISLEMFKETFRKIDKGRLELFKGYDSFFTDSGNSNYFVRHRYGDKTNELTYKRKLISENNFIRIESNVLLAKEATPKSIAYFCSCIGFELDSQIYKESWVYKTKKFVAAFYVVKRLIDPLTGTYKHLNTFIEIEAREDYLWKSETEAYNYLCKLESRCKNLGMTPQRRIKKSLFELYRK